MIFDFSIFRSLFVENWSTVDSLNVGSTTCNAVRFLNFPWIEQQPEIWVFEIEFHLLRVEIFLGGRTETLNESVSKWMRNRSLDGVCSLCRLKRNIHLISAMCIVIHLRSTYSFFCSWSYKPLASQNMLYLTRRKLAQIIDLFDRL